MSNASGHIGARTFSLADTVNVTIDGFAWSGGTIAALDIRGVSNATLRGISVEHCHAPFSPGTGIHVSNTGFLFLRDAQFYNTTGAFGWAGACCYVCVAVANAGAGWLPVYQFCFFFFFFVLF